MAIDKDNPQSVIVVLSDSEEKQKGTKRGRQSGTKKKKSVKRGRICKTRALRSCSDVEIWTADDKKAEDDDCIILTSDPLSEIDLNRQILKSDDSKDDDDVVLLAESGKVACRDYPHPRHTCAEYPFNKTNNEKHCSNCFCYVCDIGAPCKYWRGQNGHCNASNADKNWTFLRKNRQLVKKN